MSKNIQTVLIGVVRQDGKYLLTMRRDPDKEVGSYVGHWQFPGGGLEFGESLEECLLREMKEEIGQDVKIIQLIPRVFTDIRRSWQGILICYLCELVDADGEIRINEEATEYGWFTFNEIKNLQQLKWTYEIVEEAEKLRRS